MKDVLKAVDKTSSNVVKSTPNKTTTGATTSRLTSGQVTRKQDLPKFFENQTATDFNRSERAFSIGPKKDLNISRTVDNVNSNKQIPAPAEPRSNSKQKARNNSEVLINLGDLDSLKLHFDKQPKDEGLLHTAIKSGHLKIVDFLLSRNLSPNYVSHNEPALCLAARLNLCEIVLLLLKHGANTAVFDASKRSPLAYAVQHECAACLTALFEHMEKNNKGQFCLSALGTKAEGCEPLRLAFTEKVRGQDLRILATVPIRFINGGVLQN